MKCGIKEYDELPGRIGIIDVDYLRWILSEKMIQLETTKYDIKKIKQKLDDAIKKNET